MAEPEVDLLASTVDLPPDPMDKVRRRVEKLVDATFEHCERTMAVGTPADKLAIAKNVLPQLIRVLGEQAEADVHAEMRDALAEMREAFRSTVAQVAPMLVADVDLEDAVVPEDPS